MKTILLDKQQIFYKFKPIIWTENSLMRPSSYLHRLSASAIRKLEKIFQAYFSSILNTLSVCKIRKHIFGMFYAVWKSPCGRHKWKN